MKPITAKFPKRESDLTTTIQRVLNNMKNNQAYPDPPPALAELEKKAPELQDALANAKGRDITMVSIKNDQKAIALNLLQEVADYVTLKSKGDRTLILSSGFYVNGETNYRSNQPPSIEKLEVDLGPSGEATTRVKNTTGVKAYIHQYTTEQPTLNTVWAGMGTSLGSYTFEGLISDKRYWFRVVVVGTNDQRAYSPVVSRVIQ
jgi:hypothetical protein